MDKKEIRKQLIKEIKNILKPIDFIAKSDTLYIRITQNNVMHIVALEFGTIGFTCSVAIQPLYTFDHTNFFSLSMGSRLSRFKIVQKEWWSYDEPEKGINDIKNLLISNGLPWFEKYGSPKGIIDFINKGLVKDYGLIQFDYYNQKLYLGFSYFYIGKLKKGKTCINEYIEAISDDAVDFIHVYKKELIALMDELTEDNVSSILSNLIYSNKIDLKI